MNSISDEKLLAYAADELDRAEAAAIESHLTNDPAAAATVARYRDLCRSMQADTGIEPPPEVVARAKSIFEARAPVCSQPGEPWWTRLEQVIASLIFDSRPQPALAGFRSAESGFQLAFESGGTAVDVQVQHGEAAQAGSWQLMGQIDVETGSRGGEVALVPSGESEAVALTSTDTEGVFTLEVPPGRYDLYFRSRTGSIVCPNIELA